MTLKIKPEVQITYTSVLEAEVVFDIAREHMGFIIPTVYKTHLRMLKDYCNSQDVRITMKNNKVHLVQDPNYNGIRMNFQQLIEYAAKQ